MNYDYSAYGANHGNRSNDYSGPDYDGGANYSDRMDDDHGTGPVDHRWGREWA